MKFSVEQGITILQRTPSVLQEQLSGLPDSWLRSNEGPNTWSPYDIVGHLIYGEKTDWMTRLKIILSDNADKRFAEFDRFAQFNEDQSKTIEQLLEEFASLRKANLDELQSLNLQKDQFALKGIHPAFGEVTISQLLSTWVIHDLGHVAQISRVMAKQYKGEVGPWKEYLPILK